MAARKLDCLAYGTAVGALWYVAKWSLTAIRSSQRRPADDVDIPGAHKARLPDFIAPQLATLVKEPPTGDQWLHELKFDGYRLICRIDNGKVQFWTRNQNNWTAKFPNLSEAAKLIPVSTAILDGEVVIYDQRGHTSFQKLQQTMGRGDAGFVYEAFDLIYLDGFSLARTSLIDRKALLKELIDSIPNGRLRYSDHIEGNGRAFFKQACAHGIEGIVSKLATSFYDSGRSSNWLKVKCTKRQEFVIAGYTTSKKGMPGFGSLILGVYQNGKFIYSGRVGTGFTEKQRVELKKKLDKISRTTPPFDIQPKDPDLRDAHWTHPKLVGEVAFTEWTSDGSIRHPSFQGLREDKNPEDVHRELPKKPRN